MRPQAKKEYFEVPFKRCEDAGGREKTKMTDKCRAVCGYHRKHATRRFRGCKQTINDHLPRHFTNRGKPIGLTRGRAYHKGENAHIAQEDRIHVRRLFGNQRLDTPKVVSLMNNHHREARRLYHNVFSPCVNLIEKERVGSKTIDRHDDPKTPHQRIMDFDPIPQTTKNALVKRLYEKR